MDSANSLRWNNTEFPRRLEIPVLKAVYIKIYVMCQTCTWYVTHYPLQIPLLKSIVHLIKSNFKIPSNSIRKHNIRMKYEFTVIITFFVLSFTHLI